MSKAINPVPICHKITLTIGEASELSNISINRINAMLRKPNCPFVLFVEKNWSNARSLKSLSAKAFISDSISQILAEKFSLLS